MVRKRCPHRFDSLAHLRYLVAGQVGGDHEVSRLQRGAEKRPYIHKEGIAIDRAVKHHGRGQRIHAHPRDERRRFPMPVRDSRRDNARVHVPVPCWRHRRRDARGPRYHP